MLKLLLASSGYAVIVQVVYELKQSANDEKHRAATHLQSTVQAILPANEHKLRNTATAIAKQHCEKVITFAYMYRVPKSCSHFYQILPTPAEYRLYNYRMYVKIGCLVQGLVAKVKDTVANG